MLLWLLSRSRLTDLILRCHLASESFQKTGELRHRIRVIAEPVARLSGVVSEG